MGCCGGSQASKPVEAGLLGSEQGPPGTKQGPPADTVREAMKKLEESFQPPFNTDSAVPIFSQDCKFIVNGAQKDAGGSFTGKTPAECAEFLGNLRSTMGGNGLTFDVKSIDGPMHTDSFATDSGTGTSKAMWKLIGDKWVIVSYDITLTPLAASGAERVADLPVADGPGLTPLAPLTPADPVPGPTPVGSADGADGAIRDGDKPGDVSDLPGAQQDVPVDVVDSTLAGLTPLAPADPLVGLAPADGAIMRDGDKPGDVLDLPGACVPEAELRACLKDMEDLYNRNEMAQSAASIFAPECLFKVNDGAETSKTQAECAEFLGNLRNTLGSANINICVTKIDGNVHQDTWTPCAVSSKATWKLIGDRWFVTAYEISYTPKESQSVQETQIAAKAGPCSLIPFCQ